MTSDGSTGWWCRDGLGGVDIRRPGRVGTHSVIMAGGVML